MSARLTRDELIEEVQWLTQHGVTHPERIAFQLGTTVDAISGRLRRAGRTDLALPFDLASKNRRRAARVAS